MDVASSSSRGSSRGDEMASLGELRLRAGPYQILAILLLQICEGVFRVADVLSMTLFYSFLFFSVLVLVLCAAGIGSFFVQAFSW